MENIIAFAMLGVVVILLTCTVAFMVHVARELRRKK
jgi:hypothetical protein